MNAALLPTLAQLTLGIAAFCCLSLAMERHARQGGAHFKHPLQRRRLRWAGWFLLVITLLVAVGTQGWGFGLVSLFAVLSAVTLLVVALITYRPRWLVPSLVCALVGQVLIGFYALF